eukprot:TRINITY_DN19350_c0_g1_i2.p1 TRINITY_DN19350_c0_g1~~TRINITY_DN19350_c0_g1_i2.p1  ORF type:complete len:289 (+),score=44.80 TRINITY_DN19350_c0_g1_i2:58-867(+)
MLALLVCLSHCVGQPSPTDGDDVTDAQSLGQLLAGGFVALASVGCLIAYCWYAERKHRGAAEHEATVELDTVQVAAEEPVAESADERETSAVLSAVLSREGTSHCSSVAGREEEVLPQAQSWSYTPPVSVRGIRRIRDTDPCAPQPLRVSLSSGNIRQAAARAGMLPPPRACSDIPAELPSTRRLHCSLRDPSPRAGRGELAAGRRQIRHPVRFRAEDMATAGLSRPMRRLSRSDSPSPRSIDALGTSTRSATSALHSSVLSVSASGRI